MKVAIAGYGVEGEANYRYWSKLGADITIFDENETPSKPLPQGVDTLLGAGCFERMQGFDVVVRTASLRPDSIKTDGKIWSATNEFFEKCPVPIIGVTGTKGKGTTSTLIAKILENAGYNVWLLGNIGVPALEVLGEIQKYTNDKSQITNKHQISNIKYQISEAPGVVVFELSSFQLWDLKKSPQTAVVLMIEPDHMDVHASMEEYVAAKGNITAFQSLDDTVVYHPANKYSEQIAQQSPGQKIRYMSEEGARVVIPDPSVWPTGRAGQVWNDGTGEWIVIEDKLICAVEEVGLRGPHNLENICAAITATWSFTHDTKAIKKAVTAFTGLPHRLEFVREKDGVDYYNDSYSSAPGATIAAIKSFTQPEILICGGFDRGLEYSELANAAAAAPNIKKILLIGQTKEKIATAFNEAGFTHYELVATANFTETITHAQQSAESGDVIILSPGCASFDMFKNFQDRGEQFKKIVEELS